MVEVACYLYAGGALPRIIIFPTSLKNILICPCPSIPIWLPSFDTPIVDMGARTGSVAFIIIITTTATARCRPRSSGPYPHPIGVCDGKVRADFGDGVFRFPYPHCELLRSYDIGMRPGFYLGWTPVEFVKLGVFCGHCSRAWVLAEVFACFLSPAGGHVHGNHISNDSHS